MPLSLACSFSSQDWPAKRIGQRPLPELQQQQRQGAAEQRGIEQIVQQMAKAEPQRGGGRYLGVSAADPAHRKAAESHNEHRRARADMRQHIVQPMPLISASARKPAASASDTRFGIVMVKRSLAAANAIRAGNSRSRVMSRIIGLATRMADARSGHRRILAARNEQSGNGWSLPAKRNVARQGKHSASVSARQTAVPPAT